MKRKIAGAAVVIAAVLALSGCAGSAANRTQTDTGWVTAQYVKLPDGRKVICVMSDTKISCDWAGAR